MKNIVALRVIQRMQWNEAGEYYESSSWSLVYQEEGSTDWKEIPVLNNYYDGPFSGMSEAASEVKTEKE